MIIKELTRTGKSSNAVGSRALIEYIVRYSARSTKTTRSFTKAQVENVKLLLTHNIRGKSIDAIVAAFTENAKNRVDQRRNMTLASHVIMSFSPKSTPYLTDKALRALGREFISLRGKDNIYCMCAHFEKDHVHAHIAISSGTVDGLKSSRVSKKEFAQIKEQLSEFQKNRFPELSDSLPKHGRAKLERQAPENKAEGWIERLPDQKRKLAHALKATYAKATSMKEFLSLLKVQGIKPYYRAGKVAGASMEGDRKFRFRSLGFDTEIQQMTEQQLREEMELSTLSQIRLRSKEKDRSDDRLERTRLLEPVPVFKEAKGFGEDVFPNANGMNISHLHGDLQSLQNAIKY